MRSTQLSRFSFVAGAYVCHPRDQEPTSQSSSNSLPLPVPAVPLAAPSIPLQQQQQDDEDEDAEMLDADVDIDHASTEDDPVDRAMRIDAADKLDMDGLESDEYDEDDEDDDEDEQILFEGNRSGSARASPALVQTCAPFSLPFPSLRPFTDDILPP